jgi:hypothetical protein
MATPLSCYVFNILVMNKQNSITWIVLLVLTVISGLVSSASISYLVPFILVFAALKFIGVAFNFMELKKAHVFWKIVLVGYLVVFCSVLLLINA